MNKEVEIKISETSKTLYFFFGGLQGALGMPKFEFYNAANVLNEDKVFFRDLNQTWYHIDSNGNYKINETLKIIEKLIDSKKHQEIIFVGNSMGGYAAILFHLLTKKGRAIAFSPQTFICDTLRKKYNDNRWAEQIQSLHKLKLKINYFDLLSLTWDEKVNVEIHASKQDALDLKHAEHIADKLGVKTLIHNEGGHQLVKYLRDKKLIEPILKGLYHHISF